MTKGEGRASFARRVARFAGRTLEAIHREQMDRLAMTRFCAACPYLVPTWVLRTCAHRILCRHDASMGHPRRHHFNPEFYLRQWAGADGLFCEIKNAHGKVDARRKSPRATGSSATFIGLMAFSTSSLTMSKAALRKQEIGFNQRFCSALYEHSRDVERASSWRKFSLL